MENDLYLQLEAKQLEMEKSVKLLRKTGEARAEKERDYKMLLSVETLKLREQGMPVGMIDKVVYGLPNVAKARFERDVADVTYSANQDHYNAIKLQIRILDSQLQREYGIGGI